MRLSMWTLLTVWMLATVGFAIVAEADPPILTGLLPKNWTTF
jgi:hypothetical protein